MAYSDVIDTSLPAGSDDPAEADNNMRRIQGGFQEILDVEHDAALTGTEITGDGKHTDITTDSIVNAGSLVQTGDLTINTNKFTVDAATGNVVVAGTLGVTGIATLGDGSKMASSAAPSADAELANKKYVDDQIMAIGGYQAPQLVDDSSDQLTHTTVYKAITDGEVTAWGDSGVSNGYINGFVGSTSNPTTAMGKSGWATGRGEFAITFSVKKDYYWKVTLTGVSPALTDITWTPAAAGTAAPEAQ